MNSPKDIIDELSKHKVYRIDNTLELDFGDGSLNSMIVADKEVGYSATEF